MVNDVPAWKMLFNIWYALERAEHENWNATRILARVRGIIREGTR